MSAPGSGRPDRLDPAAHRALPPRAAEGEPSFGRQLGQIGVLGWIVVTPMLVGLFVGRWLDHHFGTGIFWTAPLLMLGAVLGCWSAWRWMHEP